MSRNNQQESVHNNNVKPRGKADDIDSIVDDVNQVFQFGFARCGEVSDVPQDAIDHWGGVVRQTFLGKLHALELLTQSRGIDIDPLINIAMSWKSLWRQYPDPRTALEHFREFFDEQWVCKNYAPLARKVVIAAQLELPEEKAADTPEDGNVGGAGGGPPPSMKKPSQALTRKQVHHLFVKDPRTVCKHADSHYDITKVGKYYYIDLALVHDAAFERAYLKLFEGGKPASKPPAR